MVSSRAFLAALRFVSHAAAEKDVRSYLLGVALEFSCPKEEKERCLYLIATDGHRLARASIRVETDDLPDLDRAMPPIILDNASVAKLLSIKKPSPAESAAISRPEKPGAPCVVTLGGTSMACSTIDERFPDWRRVFPKPAEVVAGTRNEAYFNPAYVAEGLVALSRLYRDVAAPYPCAGIAHHADCTILSAPLFDRDGITDAVVKIMCIRK